MQQELNNLKDDHDLPPRDIVTKEKIDRHLSDEKDTISEEDIRNINTDVNTFTEENTKSKGEKKFPADENKIVEPEKELPTTWDILD